MLSERLDKATLERLYNQGGLSARQIAERYGSTASTVCKLMESYGIPRRAKGWTNN